MAQRRMFSKKITDTDKFLEMPLSSQSLYFHLNMHADDDGFVANPNSVKRMTGAHDDDLKLLIAKQFIFVFESGVVVIRDWKIHNYIAKDRYTKTIYSDEKQQLSEDANGAYSLNTGDDSDLYTERIQPVDGLETQVRLGKDRLGKDSKEHSPAIAEQFPWQSVIDYLNEKTGKHFKHTAANKTLIMARHKEGYNADDMRKVIDNKTADWLKDSKMNKFLQPSTLFRASKFEGYLNQTSSVPQPDPHMNLDKMEDF
ncbi:conserved phage C-terminal domain-containing protein [Furfurilactobacillus milii]|uniref:DNA replication protein n=1 Tax=Furfurilactobacillus rossiae TaxID=231049 RepID=A0A7C9NN09_9LACO|nr:conserved phage C-terminal domain-containing protein [Furfurilactobacillus milii]MYV04431.1 DNA replication protein [Furfurilactobacillus milii]